MSESVASQSTDQSSESLRRITRTYGRTYEDSLVTGRERLSERNARDDIKSGESIKEWGGEMTQRGTCTECGRAMHVRADGLMRSHRDPADQRCPGGGRPPQPLADGEPAWVEPFYEWARTDKSPGSYSAAFASGWSAALRFIVQDQKAAS